MATVPSSSRRPNFTKPGLRWQFEFNSETSSIITPVAEAPEEFDTRSQLLKAIHSQQNELLSVADSNPDVWEFYDQHNKAESMQASNLILAAFLRKKKKKEEKKPVRVLMWKSKFQPYTPMRQQPFRRGSGLGPRFSIRPAILYRLVRTPAKECSRQLIQATSLLFLPSSTGEATNLLCVSTVAASNICGTSAPSTKGQVSSELVLFMTIVNFGFLLILPSL
ncbi:unnamed protein product [Strongylus vulgaris]|uniref:Uncharacterized protein n=1 Tax=Strongylus vulgaris TaxID=40348 RepID=A0A3P7IQB9_STRVU|nr:unnamed protein product [Strongylus vulgaris]